MQRQDVRRSRSHYTRTEAARRRRQLRPLLTSLEDRSLLATFTVTNSNDSGSGSLRQAIASANSQAGDDVVTFDSTVFGSTAKTITLNTGQLNLSNTGTGNALTIQGPGAGLLSINGNNASRVLYMTSGKATLSGVTVAGGVTPTTGTKIQQSGAGMLVSGSTLTLTGCTISGNTAASGGGGGLNIASSTVTMSGCTVSGNLAQNNGTGGGLNIASSTVTLTGCTVSGNHSGGGGGLNIASGTVTLTGCTVAGNGAGNGGGVAAYGGTATLTGCTVTGNFAGAYGGGVYEGNGGTANLTSTIVAGNNDPTDDVHSYGAFNVNGSDLIGGNPKLGSLGWYGGTTQTVPLLPGSSATGRGSAAGRSTDQRGFALPSSGVDIGAFQTQTNPLQVNSAGDGLSSGSGLLNLRQAINLASLGSWGSTVSFDPTVFGSAKTIKFSSATGPISVSNSLTIAGPGSNLLTIDGQNATSIFQFSSGFSTVSGLTLTRGLNTTASPNHYGAVYLASGAGLTFTNSVITNSGLAATGNLTSDTTFQGGGILSFGTLNVVNSTFSNDGAYAGGAIAVGSGSSTSVVNSNFQANGSGTNGGAIYNLGQLSVGNSTFVSNTASAGGAITARGPTRVTSSTFQSNVANYGGAIDNYNASYSPWIGDSVFSGGSAAIQGPEVSNSVISTGHNIVDKTDGSSGWGSTDFNGTNSSPVSAQLGSLASNGGPTQTVLPSAATSPIYGGGSVSVGNYANGDAPDRNKFFVRTDTGQSGSAVSDQNGKLQFKNRGYLNTIQQYNPANGGLQISGEWTFGSTSDFLQVLTRSDGTPNASNYGETTNGIEFQLSSGGMNISARGSNLSVPTVGTAFSISAGTVYHVKIIDTGSSLSFSVTPAGGSTTTLTTTCTSTVGTNYVTIHNREASVTSTLANLVITNTAGTVLLSDNFSNYTTLATDQRGVIRPTSGTIDTGATDSHVIANAATVSSVSATGATFTTTVNPNGSFTTVKFQFSSDPSFNPSTSSTIGSGFSRPNGVAVDGAGNVYVADTGNNVVKKILPDGRIQTFPSGFSSPYGVAVDTVGSIYVADTGNNRITKLLPFGGVTSIFTGFSSPSGVAVDNAGNIYVADTGNNAVKVISTTGVVTSIGSGFSRPSGVAVDNAGNVFVADSGNNAIKEILANSSLRTIGGVFKNPTGVAVDSAGNVFVADLLNKVVKEVFPDGTITTLSIFGGPYGVAVDAASNVFVVDNNATSISQLSTPAVMGTPTLLTGSSPLSVSAVANNLSPFTTYYVRVATTNSTGTAYGPAVSFRTFLPTSVTVSASGFGASGPTYGQAFLLNATVPTQAFPGQPYGRVPTGTVQFLVDGNNYGAPVTLYNGTGTIQLSPNNLGAGSHVFTAVYSGDSNYAPSTTGHVSQVVNPAPLTVSYQYSAYKDYDGTTDATLRACLGIMISPW